MAVSEQYISEEPYQFKIIFHLKIETTQKLMYCENEEIGWFYIFDGLTKGDDIIKEFNKRGIWFEKEIIDLKMLNCSEDNTCYVVIYFKVKYSNYDDRTISSLSKKLQYLKKCQNDHNLYNSECCLVCQNDRISIDGQYVKYCLPHYNIRDNVYEEECIKRIVEYEEKEIGKEFQGFADYINIFIVRGIVNNDNLSDPKYNMQDIFPLNEVFHSENGYFFDHNDDAIDALMQFYFIQISDEELEKMKVCYSYEN